MKLKQILLIVAISSASAVGSVALYNKYLNKEALAASVGTADNGKLPLNYVGFNEGKFGTGSDPVDFTRAANAAVPAVVHIKTKVPARKRTNNLGRNGDMDDFFEQFFPGYGSPSMIPEQRASGSGVIISDDGYIVTNNHVISSEGGGIADEINVTTSDRKIYKAKVIGRDPNSDIAVLKIDATKLPYLVYGNSNNIQLGQWVL